MRTNRPSRILLLIISVLLFYIIYSSFQTVPCPNLPSSLISLQPLADCLTTAPSYPESEKCWSDFKRLSASKAMKIIKNIPRNFEKFRISEEKTPHAPHQLLLPTHTCDPLFFSRLGGSGSYTNKPEHHKDGPKWVCPEFLPPKDLVVFSFGSNGDFQFEQAINSFYSGNVKIYTFDCTGKWEDNSTTFLPWCLGSTTFDTVTYPQGLQYKTWADIKKLLNVSHVHLLKIDIEGSEWDFFDALETEESIDSLPEEILVETHFSPNAAPDRIERDNFWVQPVIRWFEQIERMGYFIANKERNPRTACCAEYILVKDPKKVFLESTLFNKE